MKLIDQKTRAEIKPGDKVTTFRGEPFARVSFAAPRHAGSTGKVYCREIGSAPDAWTNEWYPSVINAEIVE